MDLPFKNEAQEVFVCFNKLTGAHISSRTGGSEADLPTNYFKWKVCFFDPNVSRWVGDHDDGEVKPFGALKNKSTESAMNVICSKKILKLAPVHKQLNSMSQMFQALIDKGVLSQEDPGVAEFTEIRDRIERTRKNNELYKETRKNSPYEDYATKEQEDQKLNDQLAGGLNVITGRGR